MDMPYSKVIMNISRTKYLEQTDLRTDLKRCLTTTDLAIIGIANMVGSGLYVLTGDVAKYVTGPSVIISYILAGLLSLMAAVCYAEFGGKVPKTGSAFIYAYVTMGELWAFLIGWNLVLEYIVASAAVATAWSGSLDKLTGYEIKNFTIQYVMNDHTWQSPIFANYPDIVAFTIICIVISIICIGVSFSSNIMNACVSLNVMIVAIMFILSLTRANVSNFTAGNGFFAFGFSGVISGAATCFFAFVGFDAIALATEEALTPNRSTPIAAVSSVIVVICLYVVACVTLTLMVPYYDINPTAAFPAAFESIDYKWAEIFVAIGTLIGMGSSLLGGLFALPRSVYAMAVEGLLFPCFARLNERTQVPVISTIVFGLISALLALVLELSALVEFLSIGTLMAYAWVAGAVIFQRYDPGKDGTLTPCHEYGVLKTKFNNFPIIRDFVPGRAVRVCYSLSVVFQFLCLIVVFQVHDFLSKPWAISSALIFFILAILLFIPIPLHNQNQDFTTFKTPFVPYFPALSAFFNIVLMVKLPLLTWLRFLVWVTIGLVIYAFYGYNHSVEGERRRGLDGGTKDYTKMSNDEHGGIDYGSFELQKIK